MSSFALDGRPHARRRGRPVARGHRMDATGTVARPDHRRTSSGPAWSAGVGDRPASDPRPPIARTDDGRRVAASSRDCCRLDSELRLADQTTGRAARRSDCSPHASVGVVVPPLVLGLLQGAGLVVARHSSCRSSLALAGAVVGPLVVHTASSSSGRTRSARDLRYQVSAYLDVVTMLLAGNTGYEGALEQAAHAGDGRLFAELRRRMRESAPGARASPKRWTGPASSSASTSSNRSPPRRR